MTKAVFLDRDGVINRKPPEGAYVVRPEEMHLLSGVAHAIALFNQAGFRVLVVTNQRCVAKGLITVAGLESIHREMYDALARAGARVDGVYFCPHEEHPPCRCRKPAPGMLLEAALTHEIDLAASWMIGDSEIDVEAGRRAGCRTAHLFSGVGNAHAGADVVAPSLLEAAHEILRREQSRATASRRIGTNSQLSSPC